MQSQHSKIIEQLPHSLRRCLNFECLYLTREYLDHSQLDTKGFDIEYFPEYMKPFQLPCYWVAQRHLYIYGKPTQGADELNIFDGDGPEGKVLLAIHPSALDAYTDFLDRARAVDAAKHGPRIWAVPTASTRTVLAWPDTSPEKAVLIKTSLRSPVLGDRRLQCQEIRRSVAFSTIFEHMKADLPDTVDYFSESVGFAPRAMQDSGVIVRSIPQRIMNGQIIAAPLFALMGGNAPNLPLFLFLHQQRGFSTEGIIHDLLCAPFTRCWLELSMQHGFLLEAHGQNLLLSLTPDTVPTGRFLYRDFGGLLVDWELRNARGLRLPDVVPRSWCSNDAQDEIPYGQGQLIYFRLLHSLFCFGLYILQDLERSILEWQQQGLIRDTKLKEGDMADIFSYHLSSGIEKMFGVRITADFNILSRSRFRKRFIILIMKLRKDLISAYRSSRCA